MNAPNMEGPLTGPPKFTPPTVTPPPVPPPPPAPRPPGFAAKAVDVVKKPVTSLRERRAARAAVPGNPAADRAVFSSEPPTQERPVIAPPKKKPRFSFSLKRGDRSPRELSRLFRHEVRRLKDSIDGSEPLYRQPWVMMVGPGGAGKTSLLASTPLVDWSSRYAARFPAAALCGWWCSRRGIVLDIAGELVVGKDGQANDRAWNRLLRLLRRYRYRRPLDGVVIAVSAADLIGPTRLGDDEIARRAAAIAARLQDLAHSLSMVLPAYLVVTQCDHVTGFRSFSHRVPAHLTGDLFGWSNPAEPDLAYASHWVEDAFASVGSVVSPVQLEMLAERAEQSDADELFLFPTELDSLLPGLHAYADRIFRAGSAATGLMLRGVYFVGDGADVPAPVAGPGAPAMAAGMAGVPGGNGTAANGAPANSAAASGAPANGYGANASPAVAGEPAAEPKEPVRSIRFGDAIFFRKVFAEGTLAQPVSRSRLAAHRGVLALQIGMALVVVISLIAATVEYPRIERSLLEVHAILDTERNDLWQVRAGQRLTDYDYAEFAEHLLDGLVRVDSLNLTSPFFPSSYFSGLHDSVDFVLGRAFTSLIMRAMYHQLNARANDLQGIQYRQVVQDSTYTVFAVENSPEYRNVKQFTEQMVRLERHAVMYNELPRTRSVKHLGDLILFLFGRRLPASFMARADHYGDILEVHDTPTFDFEKHHEPTVRTARVLLERLEHRMFRDNIVIASARAVVADLTFVQSPSASGFQVAGRLAGLADRIEILQSALRDTATAWIARPEFVPSPELRELLESMDSSALTGTSHPGTEFTEHCHQQFAALKNELRAQVEGTIGGPVVEQNDATLRTAPVLDSLRLTIDELLGQRFMQVRVQERLLNKRIGGHAVLWSNEPLAQARKLADMYNAYAGDGLAKFPQRLQGPVTRAMKAGTDASMTTLVNAAQRNEPAYGTLDNTRREIRSLSAAAENLVALLGVFDGLQLPSHRDLVSTLTAQCDGMLTDLSRGRDRQGLYSLGDDGLRRWLQDPDKPFALTVFDGDQATIADKLASDRQTVQELVDQGSSQILGFMASTGLARTGRYEEWRKIATELQRYDTKVPGNSVAMLEKLFLDLDGIDEVNYRDRLVRMGSTNYFLTRREVVRRMLDSIFTRLLHIRARRQYNDMVEEFNAAFVGRYPFADFNVNRAQAPGSASLASLQGFMRRFDTFNSTYDIVWKRWGRDSATLAEKSAYRYLDSLRRVRTFLAPLFDTTTENVPSFPVEVELRVNQVKEIEGKDIIDWALEIGEHSISTQEYVRRGRVPWRVDWHVGDRIRLVLRWAANSDVVPREIFLGSGHVRDRAAEYTFNVSAWSLLHLLNVHRAPSNHVERGSLPNVLEFYMGTVPVVSASSAVTHFTPPTLGEARVFLRVTPVGRGRRDLQAMPVFPTTNGPEL